MRICSGPGSGETGASLRKRKNKGRSPQKIKLLAEGMFPMGGKVRSQCLKGDAT